MPCSVAVGYPRFEEPCCIHIRWYPTATVHGVTTAVITSQISNSSPGLHKRSAGKLEDCLSICTQTLHFRFGTIGNTEAEHVQVSVLRCQMPVYLLNRITGMTEKLPTNRVVLCSGIQLYVKLCYRHRPYEDNLPFMF
jgi:hypothetical protein